MCAALVFAEHSGRTAQGGSGGTRVSTKTALFHCSCLQVRGTQDTTEKRSLPPAQSASLSAFCPRPIVHVFIDLYSFSHPPATPTPFTLLYSPLPRPTSTSVQSLWSRCTYCVVCHRHSLSVHPHDTCSVVQTPYQFPLQMTFGAPCSSTVHSSCRREGRGRTTRMAKGEDGYRNMERVWVGTERG